MYPRQQRAALRDVRSGALVLAVLTLLGLPVGWAVAGSAGLLAVVLAAATVVCFYALGMLVVSWVALHHPRALVPAGLATYAGQVILFGVGGFRLAGSDVVDRGTFAAALVAATAVWCLLLVRRAVRP